MSDCCGKPIDVNQMEAKQRRVLIWVLVINVVTFVMMVFGFYVSHATSLLSGTLDNLGDAITYAISLAVVGANASTKAKVALFKGALIFCAALAVATQILWRIWHPETPIFTSMGLAAFANLAANGLCLWLLSPHRNSDVNMSSVWECSRNDVAEGLAVLVAVALVAIFDSGWPDLIVASALLILFLRSSWRVLRNAVDELRTASADPVT